MEETGLTALMAASRTANYMYVRSRSSYLTVENDRGSLSSCRGSLDSTQNKLKEEPEAHKHQAETAWATIAKCTKNRWKFNQKWIILSFFLYPFSDNSQSAV